MKFFRSIYIKVSLILIFSIIFTISVESIIVVVFNHNRAVSDLKNLSNTLKNRLQSYLKEPLWTNDKATIEIAILQEMTDKNIFSILVKDENKEMILGYERDNNWRPKDIKNPEKRVKYKDQFSKSSDEITRNGKTIGFLEIIISNKFLKPSFSNLFFGILLRAFLVSIIIILLIFISLKKIILDRIVSVKDVVEEFTLNNYSERCDIKIDDEIGDLGTTFNVMADAIQNYNLQILTQLYFDKLTDLPNRKKLISDIEKEINPLLILVNIDSFQEINDFYGNDVGDKILIEMSSRLKMLLLKKNLGLYKMGGDEFAILISHTVEFEDSFEMYIKKVMIDSLFEEINDKVFYIEDYEINVRITIGVAYYKENSVNTKITKNIGKNILIYADMALKKAKKLQKHFIIYTDKMQISKEYENNIKWTLELKKAIYENRIVPYFQPILNNKTGKIEKFECLVRLIDKTGKIVSPFEFLEVAKKSRIYPFITKIMISKSFDIFSKLDYEFSINLSVYD
ncbi:MAG TPA: diguanylate cyclase, partial [Spirochaetota bacterium]|nr:diguanylate cyclase [Spirochaetota bacterium]